jgi:hypothetical protein
MDKICIALIPIYKSYLTQNEIRNITHSLKQLEYQNCVVSWLAPDNIDRSFYDRMFPHLPWSFHAPVHFRSVTDYSRLLLSEFFYEAYDQFEFMLIVQPDAVVLTPTLNEWLNTPYDYVGAPWPKGWEFALPVRLRGEVRSVTCRAFVGNGGLSLRRSRKIIQLLREFPEARTAWSNSGNPEDLLISMIATLSPSIILPTLGAASRFSLELEPEFFGALFDDSPPFGLHGDHHVIGKFIERHHKVGIL